MKHLLLYALLLLTLFSCDNSAKTSRQQLSSNGEAPSGGEQSISINPLRDSLLQEEEELQAELALLKDEFEFKEQDFSGRSYYHQNWWGAYYISDQALLAAVDSVGNFYLIANVWTLSYSDLNLDPLQITIDSTHYLAHSSPHFPLKEPLAVTCACGFHQAYFSDQDAEKLGEAISNNPDKPITWVGVKTLTQRDLEGIKASYELSTKLRRLLEVEEQLKQLPLLPAKPEQS